MSECLGQEISASMLNNWTAEAHEKHRFPAQFLPVFVRATGGQRRAFEVLSRKSGLFALPGPDALRADIQRDEEMIQDIRKRKKKKQAVLSAMEKGL
jgi:hypothetical protein